MRGRRGLRSDPWGVIKKLTPDLLRHLKWVIFDSLDFFGEWLWQVDPVADFGPDGAGEPRYSAAPRIF